MVPFTRRTLPLVSLLFAFAFAGCTNVPRSSELLNLSDAKAAVVAYHDSGDYTRELGVVAAQAEAWLRERAARRTPNERLAVVFDLDETLLSNYPQMRAQDFGYVPAEWEEWVDRAEAPPIEPVAAVYRAARELGLAIFLITGRKEPRERAGTELNLRRAGLADYNELILATADGQSHGSAERKAAARRRLEEQGYTIVASIGDQWSDLTGGHAERTFKLPNPFYAIP